MLMEVEDYMLMCDGYRTQINIESGLLRRQTYWIIDTAARVGGAKNGINIDAFNSAWPLDDEVIEDVNEILEARKKVGIEQAIKMSNDINLREAVKKLKGGGGNQNSHRSRR